MEQAKIVINLDQGVIQIEGPVEFVREYMAMYAPQSGGRSLKKTGVAEVKVARAKKRATIAKKGARACARILEGEVLAGFFDQPKSIGDVSKLMAGQGVTCTTAALRATLKKSIAAGNLLTTGRGRATRYVRRLKIEQETPEEQSSEKTYAPQ